MNRLDEYKREFRDAQERFRRACRSRGDALLALEAADKEQKEALVEYDSAASALACEVCAEFDDRPSGAV